MLWYFSINSTIELPIIIASEKELIFLADSAFFIPKPTATGIFELENPLIVFTLFFTILILSIVEPVIPFRET